MYWMGYHFGRGVLRDQRWWARWVTPEWEARIEMLFQQHGLKVFFVARFLVACVAGLPDGGHFAGLVPEVRADRPGLRYGRRRQFFGLTYFVGKNYAELFKTVEVWGTVAAVIGLAGVAFFLWRRHRRKLAARQSRGGGVGAMHPSLPQKTKTLAILPRPPDP